MPFFRFPFFYNPSYYKNKVYNFNPNFPTEKSILHTLDYHKKNLCKNDFDTAKKTNNSKNISSDENCFFELFGLKLFFDDILLITLIFFLYQEGVKDDELFLSLILLLLS